MPPDYILCEILRDFQSTTRTNKRPFCPKPPKRCNLVGSGTEATPSQQNGTYRPGIPLFDQYPSHQAREKALVESCRNTSSCFLNQLLSITYRTGRLITDCHRFILIQIRRASAGSKPDLIMIRWNVRGFFHFFNCVDLSRLRIQASRFLNRYRNS